MEEKKIVMPPPPKELRNMPPPPPQKKEEEIKATEPQQQSEEKVEKQEVVKEDPKLEVKTVQSAPKEKKSAGGMKTAFYWIGFVLSVSAIGVLIFLLVK